MNQQVIIGKYVTHKPIKLESFNYERCSRWYNMMRGWHLVVNLRTPDDIIITCPKIFFTKFGMQWWFDKFLKKIGVEKLL
jgi:hypothetical protein